MPDSTSTNTNLSPDLQFLARVKEVRCAAATDPHCSGLARLELLTSKLHKLCNDMTARRSDETMFLFRAVYRLSIHSTSSAVRDHCKKVLGECAKVIPEYHEDVKPVASRFICESPSKEITFLDSDCMRTERLVRNLQVVLECTHPEFARAFIESTRALMEGEGPLSIPLRHCVAAMAASRHDCEYLVRSELETLVELDCDSDSCHESMALAERRMSRPVNTIAFTTSSIVSSVPSIAPTLQSSVSNTHSGGLVGHLPTGEVSPASGIIASTVSSVTSNPGITASAGSVAGSTSAGTPKANALSDSPSYTPRVAGVHSGGSSFTVPGFASAGVRKKLAALEELNCYLAHRPYSVESSHIAAAMSAAKWGTSELIHALAIMVTFHAMCSLVFGTGVRLEEDMLSDSEWSELARKRIDTWFQEDELIVSEPVWNSETDEPPKCFQHSANLLRRLKDRQVLQPAVGISSSITAPSIQFQPSSTAVPNQPVEKLSQAQVTSQALDKSSFGQAPEKPSAYQTPPATSSSLRMAELHASTLAEFEGFGSLAETDDRRVGLAMSGEVSGEQSLRSGPSTSSIGSTGLHTLVAMHSSAVGHSAPAVAVVGSSAGGQLLMTGDEKEELQSIMQSKPVYSNLVACNAVKGVFAAQSASTSGTSSGPTSPASSAPRQYHDLNLREDKLLHTHEFSWEEQACPLITRALPASGVADLIDSEYRLAIETGNNKIGSEEVTSTRPIREAFVKYVFRMYGIWNDEFQYENLNKVLPLIHKVFLKKMSCFPERLTRADYERIVTLEGLSHSDMVHYAFIVYQVRRVAALTFMMRAVSKYQSSQ